MIISFAHTTPALLAGAKTVSRRNWAAGHAAKFRAGQTVDAWSASPHHGGKKVAEICLTEPPYLESTSQIPRTDWWLEGFQYMEDRGLFISKGVTPLDIWNDWADNPRTLWVIRFHLVKVV